MANPSAKVEIGFTSSWDATSPSWVDVTDYVRQVEIERGRRGDLDPFDIGTAYVQLDNRDGRFNPTNTASPYYPNVKPRKQIRITGTYDLGIPTRTNLVTNPSFETNTTGWGFHQASIVRTAGTISGGVGSWSLVATATVTGAGGAFFNFTPTVGQTLTASVQCLRTVGARSYRLGFEFYNGATPISGTNGTAFTCATSTRLSVTATVPATATNAYITVYSTGSGSIGDAIQIDAALLEQSSTVGDYFDGSTNPNSSWTGTAHASTSRLVGRGNLITNPSFETNTTGWTTVATSIARTTASAYVGSASLQITSTDPANASARAFTSPVFSVIAGQTYTGSAYLKNTAGNDRGHVLGLLWVDSVGGTTLALGTQQTLNVGSDWTRLTITATAPATAVTAYFLIYIQRTNQSTSNVTLADACLVEQASTVGDYFDGSTSALCSWTGTVNNSTSTEQTTTFPVYRGYIQEWPQEYPETGKDAVVNISAVDALSILGGTEVAVDELTARIQAGELPALTLRYKLGDTPNTYPQFVDSSPNARHLKASGTIETQQPLARQLGPSSAFDFFTWGDGVQQPSLGPTWSVSFWIQTVGSVAGKKEMIFTSAYGTDQEPTVYYMDSSGYLQCDTFDYIPGARGKVKTTVAVNDGVPHHIVFVHNGSAHSVYVDNVDRTNLISSTAGEFGGQVTLGRPPNTFKAEGSEVTFYGWLSEVCVFDAVLTTTQVGYLFGFGTGTNMVELTSARITRLLNSAWSTAPKSVTTGNATCAWSEWGNNALTACQKVAATENSYFFADRSGTLTFRNRYYAKQDTQGKTSQATFGDDTGIGYNGLTFRYGADDIINTVKIEAGGGINQTASTSSSTTAYGYRATNIDTLLSPVDALSMAQGIAAQYAEPILRADPFEVNLLVNAKTVSPAVLNLELGYAITVRRNANGVATPIVQNLNMTGIRHRISPDTWQTTITGTPRDAYAYFVLDTSTLDGTDVLGY